MGNRRYQYYWNEFDCKEIIFDTLAKTRYEGCELIVDLLNDKDEEIKEKDQEIVRLKSAINGTCPRNYADFIREQVKEIVRDELIDKIIDRYNLNNKPTMDSFGDTNLGCVMVSASNLREFLNQLRSKEDF